MTVKNEDHVFVDEYHYSTLPWADDGAVLQHAPDDANMEKRKANYKRAKKCVEGCYGVENPESEVKHLIALAKASTQANFLDVTQAQSYFDKLIEIGHRIT